jgi:hypothetical protein
MGKTETKINTIYLSSGVSIDDDRNGAASMTSSRRSMVPFSVKVGPGRVPT